MGDNSEGARQISPMNCPYCLSTLFTQLKRTTNLGYDIFHGHSCQRDYNERTGTPFNLIEVPTDIVFEVLLCRVRYKLSYRDVAEYFLFRGFEFTHETVRDWQERFLPLFTEQIRSKPQGKIGKIGKIWKTYVRVQGE